MERLWSSGLSSWLAKQEVRGSNAGLATLISEIGYLPLPSRCMTERLEIFKTTQPNNNTHYSQLSSTVGIYNIALNGYIRNIAPK